MIVTLLKSKGIKSLSLPSKVRGQYWVKDYKFNNDLVCIEAVEGKWVLKSNHKIMVYDKDGQECKETIVEPYQLYRLLHRASGNKASLFTEPDTEDRKYYSKYVVRAADIRIGRDKNNDIRYDNLYISPVHALLTYQNGSWEIKDSNSVNGIYVNNIRVSGSQQLKVGDLIFIMGLKIIVGNVFLAINNPDKKVQVSEGRLSVIHRTPMQKKDDDDVREMKQDYFYRSVRFKRDVEPVTIKVDAPPNNMQRDELPLMLAVGPSLTMGLASLTTGLFAVNNAIQNDNIASAIPSIVMSISMLVGTILWPILTKRYEKKRALKNEQKRQNKYKGYLQIIKKNIDVEAEKQRKILNENYLTVKECSDIVMQKKSTLWERSPEQNDFLHLRVGTGRKLADIDYHYQERRFMLDDDNLQEEMLELCENPKTMDNVPVVISLLDNYISGVVGDAADTIAFAKGLLLQMMTYYSYDEFKIVLLMNEQDAKEFEDMRWIPHVWSDDQTIRFIATNPSELKIVSAFLEQEIKYRSTLHEEEQRESMPYYMILAFDQNLANKADMLKLLYRQKSGVNVSVLSFCEKIVQLPKECTTVVEIKDSVGRIFNKKDISDERVNFMPDIYIRGSLKPICLQLANTFLDIQDTTYNLPKTLTFLELYKVGKIEHLNASERWIENEPSKSLRVPIGVDVFGEMFELDLHEKYHGPHGLVAGMTGSGKSEFIMTYILSLAINYHPYEVAFILIDYKGGGMAKAFEHLPHTAGIITNLDGAAVNRSLVSIQSELKRRQAIFMETSQRLGESNIDIYKYQELYRYGRVNEPLQHLFIISDEFAELKTQQPEFMEQLISAARIGRSLGVHLILATQKPAGVVDDQIWSNSKFKVCLKVQEKADSMDMLKRPDAAALSDTGRFYLQVGYNELFEMGQSAWAGAYYYPSDRVVLEKDDAVEIFDGTGKVIFKNKPRKQFFGIKPQKQLDAITDYLKGIAEKENVSVKPLWLEPIPEYICVDDLESKYNYTMQKWVLDPVVGEYDDPYRQQQNLLTLPLSKEGNALIYGAAGMGKTTFITAMLYSMMKYHNAESLSTYVLDFSSGSLRSFQNAPQVGDVIVTGEEEKIINLFKMLTEEVEKRKKMFAEYGGDIVSYNESSSDKASNIVVMIHNFANYIEMNSETEEDIIYLSREGTKYGIYFVVTAVNANDVRYRVSQNFNQQYVLQLNDEADYSAVLGNVNGVYPSKYKGRGIVKKDQVYEFQTAHVTSRGNNAVYFIKEFCEQMKEKYGQGMARKIPVLPDVVTAETFCDEQITLAQFPIGVRKNDLQFQHLNLQDGTITLMLGMDAMPIANVSAGVIELLQTMDNVRIVVLDPNGRMQCEESNCLQYFVDDMEGHIVKLFQQLVSRNNTYKDYNGDLPDDMVFENYVYILQDFSDICDELSEDGKDKLKILMEKNETEYAVHFLVSDEVGSFKLHTVTPWFKRHCSRGDGVWVGESVNDQFVLKISEMDSSLRKPIAPEFGYVIKNGKPQLVKLLNSK